MISPSSAWALPPKHMPPCCYRITPLIPKCLILCCLAFAAAELALAQLPEDVHVVPQNSDNGRIPSSDKPLGLAIGAKPFRVDVDLVLVPVTVSDSLEHPVITLK